MIPKRWLSLAAALSCLQALASPSSFVSATLFGDWAPVGTRGAFTVCTNASSCDGNEFQLSLFAIDEISADKSTIPHTVGGISTTQAFIFDVSRTTKWADGRTSSATRRFSAAVPTNGDAVPYALPVVNGDPILVCEVTQFVTGGLDYFGSTTQAYNAPATRGAVQVDLDVSQWMFANAANSLNMSLFISLSENAQMTGQVVTSALYSPKVMRYNLTKTVYLDLPLVAIDDIGQEVGAWVDLVGADGTYYLHVGSPSKRRIRYTFLLSGGGDIANAPTLAPPTPSPTPLPTPTPTTITPTTTPTRLPTAAPRPRPLASSFPTVLNTSPGGFEFCVAPNCNIFDGSFSVTLDRLGTDATVNSDNELAYGAVTTDFRSSNKQLVFVTPSLSSDSSAISNNSTGSDFEALFLSVPFEGGHAKRLTEMDWVEMVDTDTISMVLGLEHMAAPDTLHNDFEDIPVAKGAVKMSIAIYLPSSASNSTNVTRPAISFFISAFQHGKMVTNVTVNRQMYTTRAILGDDMYLEFPSFASADGNSYPLEVVAKLHTSGDFQGLIQLSLLIRTTIVYSFECEAVISSAAVDKGASRANASTPALASTRVQGYEIKTRILTLSHGEFGLCFNTSKCDTTSVKMAFSGLGTASRSAAGAVTQLDKFRNAAGFQFREPQLVVDGNVTKWSTGFRAFVPQSQALPPIPYDATLASTLSYPEFSVQVDQFLTHGYAMNGNQTINVPRGGLKFAINITNWVFASATDTLVLNVTLSDVMSGSGSRSTGVPGALGFTKSVNDTWHTTRTLVDVATLVDFPLLAVVDGQMQAVGVALGFDTSIGLTFTLTFPYFAHSLYYDPVLSSLALEADRMLGEGATINPPSPPPDVNLRSHGPKSTKDDAIAIILLAFLAFVFIVSAARCTKRVSVKLDFSKLVV